MKYADAWGDLKDWLLRQQVESDYGIAEEAYFLTLEKIDRLEDEYE